MNDLREIPVVQLGAELDRLEGRIQYATEHHRAITAAIFGDIARYVSMKARLEAEIERRTSEVRELKT